ncbi:MAG: TetR/AcrR family transcriptional regulator [Lachnospiraceae bacterium]
MKATEIDDKELQKKENYIRFINATRELIVENGLENLSIRKIAEKSGLHNSTIYLYFEDLDQLIMLASMKFFREYSHSLEMYSKKAASATHNFLAIWELFVDTIMANPFIFYNFFFGKRSDNLEELMRMYYDIFPEERDQFSREIEAMYFGRNIMERSLNILKGLLDETNRITSENITMINEIIVSYCKYKLMEKCQTPSLDSTKLKEDILNAISYVTGI